MRFLITAGPGTSDVGAATEQPFNIELFTAYMKFNEEMQQAGVLIASEGLAPNAQPAHIAVENGKRVLVDGPFTESKELLGGFYFIEVSSREEAVAWALRCPVGFGAADVLELHQLSGADDIPPEMQALIAEAAPTFSASFLKRR